MFKKDPYDMSSLGLLMEFEDLLKIDVTGTITDDEFWRLKNVREVIEMRMNEGTLD